MTARREDHKTEKQADLQGVLHDVQALFERLRDASEAGPALHEGEGEIWRTLWSLGHQFLAWFLSEQGTGDLGESVTLENGRELRRLDELHMRS